MSFKVPIGYWPKENRLKHIGGVQLWVSAIFEESLHKNVYMTDTLKKSVIESAEAYSLALFTRVLGYELPRLQALLASIRQELKSRDNHLYCTVHVIYGRKPLRKE